MTIGQDVRAWFTGQGWKAFAFQREVWTAMRQGKSGLLHATTGAGKTYAAWLGALQAFGGKKPAARVAPPLTVLSVLHLPTY